MQFWQNKMSKEKYVDQILSHMNLTIGNGFRNAERRLGRLSVEDLTNIEKITKDYAKIFKGNTADEARTIANRFIQYLQSRTKCGEPISDVDLEIECFENPQKIVLENPRYEVD